MPGPQHALERKPPFEAEDSLAMDAVGTNEFLLVLAPVAVPQLHRNPGPQDVARNPRKEELRQDTVAFRGRAALFACGSEKGCRSLADRLSALPCCSSHSSYKKEKQHI